MKFRLVPPLLILALTILSGCAANQPVVWDDTSTVSNLKISNITIDAPPSIPLDELEFIKKDIQSKLSSSDFWSQGLSEHKLKVVISRYESGNAFARFMLIGLGQMHLHGTVEIISGTPPKVVKSGTFKKDYAVGGIIGGSATMHKDVTSKLGQAIADALSNQSKVTP